MTLETTSRLSLGQCLPPMCVLTSGESSAHTNSPQGQTLELVPRGPPAPPNCRRSSATLCHLGAYPTAFERNKGGTEISSILESNVTRSNTCAVEEGGKVTLKVTA